MLNEHFYIADAANNSVLPPDEPRNAFGVPLSFGKSYAEYYERKDRMNNPWRSASNGAGKRHWFICRERPNADGERRDNYHCKQNGSIIWFASREAAERRARELNAM